MRRRTTTDAHGIDFGGPIRRGRLQIEAAGGERWCGARRKSLLDERCRCCARSVPELGTIVLHGGDRTGVLCVVCVGRTRMVTEAAGRSSEPQRVCACCDLRVRRPANLRGESRRVTVRDSGEVQSGGPTPRGALRPEQSKAANFDLMSRGSAPSLSVCLVLASLGSVALPPR